MTALKIFQAKQSILWPFEIGVPMYMHPQKFIPEKKIWEPVEWPLKYTDRRKTPGFSLYKHAILIMRDKMVDLSWEVCILARQDAWESGNGMTRQLLMICFKGDKEIERPPLFRILPDGTREIYSDCVHEKIKNGHCEACYKSWIKIEQGDSPLPVIEWKRDIAVKRSLKNAKPLHLGRY